MVSSTSNYNSTSQESLIDFQAIFEATKDLQDSDRAVITQQCFSFTQTGTYDKDAINRVLKTDEVRKNVFSYFGNCIANTDKSYPDRIIGPILDELEHCKAYDLADKVADKIKSAVIRQLRKEGIVARRAASNTTSPQRDEDIVQSLKKESIKEIIPYDISEMTPLNPPKNSPPADAVKTGCWENCVIL